MNGPWTGWLLGASVGLVCAAPLAARAARLPAAQRAGALAATRRIVGRGARPGLIGAALVRLGRRAGAAVPVRVAAGIRSRRRAARDADRLGRELPLVADLLAVAVGAGCTPFLAVEAAARWAPDATGRRLAGLLRSCELGTGFGDALDTLADSSPTLRPVADALSISDRTGAPVGPALARVGDDARAATRRRVEARARTVPVRLLFPLVFLVLPAFALLTVAPALLSGFARS